MGSEIHFGDTFLDHIKKSGSGIGLFFNYEDIQNIHAADTPGKFFSFLETTPYHDVLQIPDPEIAYKDFILIFKIKHLKSQLYMHWVNPLYLLGTLFLLPIVTTIVSGLLLMWLLKKRDQLNPREGPDPIT